MRTNVWMTALFDQLEAATEKFFALEPERRVAGAEGGDAMELERERERERAIGAALDEINQLAAEIARRAGDG